jgi:hypothetical protein
MKRATTLRGWDGERNPVPDVPAEPKRQSKKNTKRWCRGKVGREHRMEWIHDKKHDWGQARPPESGWWTYRCAECLKHFDYCWPIAQKCKCGQHPTRKSR